MWKNNYPEDDEVIIKIQNDRYKCSRDKLIQHSSYFEAMFGGSFKEKNDKFIDIKDADPLGFNLILKHIDEEITFFDVHTLSAVLDCSYMLQFDNIKEVCLRQCIRDITYYISLQLWHTCELHDIHPLCEIAKATAFLEFNKIKESPYLLELTPNQIHAYLSSVLLHCSDEMDVFEAGMKWWYEYFSRTELTIESESKYLLMILSCLDLRTLTDDQFKQILLDPDIKKDEEVTIWLSWIQYCIKTEMDSTDPQTKFIPEHIKHLVLHQKRRNKSLFPAVVSSELVTTTSHERVSINRMLNISYYDPRYQCMQNLLEIKSNFNNRRLHDLNGCKIIPYKECLIVCGGEWTYGSSNWNKEILAYNTFKDKWIIMTSLPKERRHFQACIIKDKLFIIGGTGKFRIQYNTDMLYYNFRTDKWVTSIHLPNELFEMHFCTYRNQLLFIRAKGGNSPRFLGYLFNTHKNTWSVIESNRTYDNIPKRYITFSEDNRIYVRGIGLSHAFLIEFKINGTELIEVENTAVSELHEAKINYFVSDSKLYVFIKYVLDDIFVLECLDLKTKLNKILFKINDPVDFKWHLSKGCFGLFPYILTANYECLSEFKL